MSREITGARAQSLRRAVVALACGVFATALALALPSGILIGRTVQAVPLDEFWWYGDSPDASADLAPYWTACALSKVFHLSHEPAWFIVSALAFGSSAAVLVRWAQRRAVAARVWMPALAAVLAAPVAWLAGTTPGTAAASMLGAILVFVALGACHNRPWRFAVGACAAWISACLLSLTNLLLWPVLAWCVAHRTWARARTASALIFVAPVCFYFAWASARGTDWARFELADIGSGLLHRVLPRLFPTEFPDMPYPYWVHEVVREAAPYALLVGGMYVGLIGAFRECACTGWLRSRTVWWLAFALVPLVLLVRGSGLLRDIPFVWFAPAALAGLVAWGRVRWTVPWLALALSLLAHLAVGELDRDRAWRKVIERESAPFDVVYTSEKRRCYLLRVRYGIEPYYQSNGYCVCTEDTRPDEVLKRLEIDKYAGRRVLVDEDFGENWLDFLGARDKVREQGAMVLPGSHSSSER